MADSTPLLDEAAPHIDNNTDAFEVRDDHAPRSAYFRIRIMVTLILSALGAALLVANYIVGKHPPSGNPIMYNWKTQEASKTLGKFMFISLVVSVINVFVNCPILLDIIINVVLAASIIPWVIRLLDAFPNSDWCIVRTYPGGDQQPPSIKCKNWTLTLKILMGIAAGFGGVVGAIYLGLFVHRSISLLRTKFWTRSFRTDSGEITLVISMNLMRRPEGSATTGNGAGHSSDAGLGRGPLYL